MSTACAIPFCLFLTSFWEFFKYGLNTHRMLICCGTIITLMVSLLIQTLMTLRLPHTLNSKIDTNSTRLRKRITELKGQNTHFNCFGVIEKGALKSPNKLCFICEDDEQCAYFKPCRHGGMCAFCSQDIVDYIGKCVWCAIPIEKSVMYNVDAGGIVTEKDYVPTKLKK